MDICNKCNEKGEIVKPGLRCRKCVNEYKNTWSRKRKNRTCEYCKKSYIPNGIAKECSLKCKLLNRKKLVGECWEWQGKITNSGYGELRHGVILLAHRASYKTFKGDIPKGLCVCHSCDNRKCINPDHLWLGTATENMQDAKNKNRLPKQPTRKFDSLQIRQIRKSLEKGKNTVELSKEYGVSQALIWYIKARKHYREE